MAVGMLAFGATVLPSGSRQETRRGDLHTLRAIPIDAHTRLVPATATRGRSLRASATATFAVTYTGFTPQARAAFQHAVDIWSNLVASPVPIAIDASFRGDLRAGVLGSAGPATVFRNFLNAPVTGTWYPVALANARAGADIGAGADVIASFSSAFPNWYFGLDGNTPPGQYDFVSVVLHEIGHGLGFIGSLRETDEGSRFGVWGFGDGSGVYPLAYDRFAVNAAGQSLINTAIFENPSAPLFDQLISNNVYWSGALGTAANSGSRPRLYAPGAWGDGSSFSHLSESSYPPGTLNSLMTPALNSAEAVHTPGPITLGMFRDMGWTASQECTYTLSTTAATISAGGQENGSVTVTTQSSCNWTAAVSAGSQSFLNIAAGASGSGSGTVLYQVPQNVGASYRIGTMTIAGHTYTVTQLGTGPTMASDRASLQFGATTTGATFVAQTEAQSIRLLQTGGGTVTWTAASSQPWLVVSPSSGTGTTTITISVRSTGALAPGNYPGAVTFTASGAGRPIQPVGVTLAVVATGASSQPFGSFDTPPDGNNITGAIPVTGWALDDLQVSSVAVCRSGASGEPLNPDGRCGGAAAVFIGNGVFIEGVRPDVQSAYAGYPRSDAAGWGLMVLTNMFPGGGNATFQLTAYAHDQEGRVTLLGSRLLGLNNAAAILPFGTIDTPGQGATIAGNAYVNFGWALTQREKIIPIDGSTITVFVDGSPVGPVTYNNYREDIATLFPGLQNSGVRGNPSGGGAVGFRVIDTTRLADGLHTISWTATDSAGLTAGLGSRFFRVANGAPLTAMGLAGDPAARDAAVTAAAVAPTPLAVRRGWRPDADWQLHPVTISGRSVVRGEELDRFELDLGPSAVGGYSVYLRSGAGLTAMPAGSQIDQSTGRFTWAPGAGFIGTYDLVFIEWTGDRVASRRDVRIILAAKGSGRVGSQVVIDTPRPQQDVGRSFVVAGWAADLDASWGTGIAAIHAWAYPLAGGPPIFLGAAGYGGARPDVAAIHGDEVRQSGFDLGVQNLAPGHYDIAVFAWSTVKGGFVPATVVRVTAR